MFAFPRYRQCLLFDVCKVASTIRARFAQVTQNPLCVFSLLGNLDGDSASPFPRFLTQQAVFFGFYTKFCKSKNKGAFRKEHSAEIALYETARKFLKEKSGNGKLPSMKLLKEKKEELLKQKKSAQEQYQYYRDYQKELNTVRSNINSILGKEYPHQKTHTKEQTLT